MSFTKTHDLCVKVGTYLKDGEPRYRFAKVGKVLVSDKGHEVQVLDRHFNPAGCLLEDGKEGVTLYKFEDTRSGNSQYRDPPKARTQQELDDTPF